MLSLSGCASVGIEPGHQYPSENFTVPLSYQEVYKRADTAMRQCEVTGLIVKSLPVSVSGDLYTDKKTGILRVNTPRWGNDLERVEISAIDAENSSVKITVFGKYQWDKEGAEALRKSIETGNTVCRAPPPMAKSGNAY